MEVFRRRYASEYGIAARTAKVRRDVLHIRLAVHDLDRRPLDKIDDPFKKVIVVGRPVERHYGKTGVLMLGLYDLLLDPASLKL